MPHNPDPWVNERFQRDQIMRGIQSAADNDLIMLSDIDEIIRSEAVEYMKTLKQNRFALRMSLHNFKLNYMKVNPDRYVIWAMAARRCFFNSTTPENFRRSRLQFFGTPYQFSNSDFAVVEHGGWHFGYLGDDEWMKDKARSTSHQAPNLEESIAQIDIAASIALRTSLDRTGSDRYVIVEVNNYFPKTVVNNLGKYQSFILDTPVENAFNLLPAYPYN